MDCSASTPALTIHKGSLDLNGFTITGDQIGCDDACTISGPGNLNVNVAGYDLFVQNLTGTGDLWGFDTLTVEGCTVSNALLSSYFVANVSDSMLLGSRVLLFSESNGRARVENTVIQDAPGDGVNAKNTVVIGSTIVRSVGAGVRSYHTITTTYRKIGKAVIVDSTIAENGAEGVVAGISISVSNSTIRDNGDVGVEAYSSQRSDDTHTPVGSVKLMQSTVSGNYRGVVANKAGVEDSVVTSSDLSGVEASSLRVRGLSDLSGNGVSPSCGTDVRCSDVATRYKPRGLNVSNCDTSWNLIAPDPGATWGLCALD
jgi:hypothetical protein